VKNKKTVLTLVFMTLIAITAYAQQYDSGSDFRTEPINDGKELAIIKYIGSKQEVRIPPAIQMLPVTSIGKWAFYDNASLAGVTIPNSVTTIEEGAFASCASLASVTIPNSVISIDEWAFADCVSLASVTIPNSVTTIVNGAFIGCKSLTAITVAADNSRFSSQNGVLYNKSITVLIQCPGGKTGAYTIPNGVTRIRNNAFRFCSLTSVTIPNSVTSIEEYAFAESVLTNVTLPNSIIVIKNNTFDGCESLTGITIPKSVTSIEGYAFSECTKLTSVTFQGTIPSSGFNNGAFNGLGDLRDKYLANGPGRYTRQNASNSTWTKR
jgi:hypothetical protein